MEESKITLKLDANQVNIILTALGELPLKMSLTLFHEIQTQASSKENTQEKTSQN